MRHLGGVGWTGTSATWFTGKTLLEATNKMVDWLVYKQKQDYIVKHTMTYGDGVLYVEYVLTDRHRVYVPK